jgi:hypothetical protein
MWLEDDVIINRKITNELNYDINGFCPNKVSDFWNISEIQQKYSFIDANKIYVFSGQGGSVFNKEKILQYFSNKFVINDILQNWRKYNFTSNICQDFMFSMITIFNNGTIGPYTGHNDSLNGIDFRIDVQHQYKVWYGIELPDELKHLIIIN